MVLFIRKNEREKGGGKKKANGTVSEILSGSLEGFVFWENVMQLVGCCRYKLKLNLPIYNLVFILFVWLPTSAFVCFCFCYYVLVSLQYYFTCPTHLQFGCFLCH